MPSNAETLTERFVVNPILKLNAPYPVSIRHKTLTKIRHFIEAEVITRIIALSIPIFAILDTLINLTQGLYKTFYSRFCCLYNVYNHHEVNTHFKRVTLGLASSVVGLLIALIAPKRLEAWYEKRDFPLFNYANSHRRLETQAMLAVLLTFPTENEDYTHAIKAFQSFWKTSNFVDKCILLGKLNQDFAVYKKFRTLIKDMVYRPNADSLPHEEMQWLSPQDLLTKFNSSAWHDKMPSIREAYYYHPVATDAALCNTLRAGRVKVEHQKNYRGAFVSTRPDKILGKYQLVFKRSIEFLSPLETGFFYQKEKTYWAGFSQPIPINEDTLIGVFVNTEAKSEIDAKKELAALENNLLKLTKRQIKVISLQDTLVIRALFDIQKLNMGIPAAWPAKNTAQGNQILTRMQEDCPSPHIPPFLRNMRSEIITSAQELSKNKLKG